MHQVKYYRYHFDSGRLNDRRKPSPFFNLLKRNG